MLLGTKRSWAPIERVDLPGVSRADVGGCHELGLSSAELQMPLPAPSNAALLMDTWSELDGTWGILNGKLNGDNCKVPRTMAI